MYIVGGHITGQGNNNEKGNLFTFPSNEFAEFNMFLDPLAAKTILGSKLNITLIPLRAQRQVSSFRNILKKMKHVNKTPEAVFARRLLLELRRLQLKDERYLHVVCDIHSFLLLLSLLLFIMFDLSLYTFMLRHNILGHIFGRNYWCSDIGS